MMFLIIGLIIMCVAYYYSRKNWDAGFLIFLFGLGLLFCSIDIYYMFQGEMINLYYNDGAGITYVDTRINITDNSTYNVSTTIYSNTSNEVGEFVVWEKSNHASFSALSFLFWPLMVGIIVYGFVALCRKVGLLQ